MSTLHCSTSWRHFSWFFLIVGKHGFVTPRDLFRWAERHSTGYGELARDGFLLLGERLRDEAEKQVVKSTLEKQMKVKLDLSILHEVTPLKSPCLQWHASFWTAAMITQSNRSMVIGLSRLVQSFFAFTAHHQQRVSFLEKVRELV